MVLKRLKQYLDLLQNEGSDVEYDDLMSALKEAAANNTNVYLIDKNGKMVAYAAETGFSASEFDEEWIVNQRIPDDLNNSLLKIGAVTVHDGHEKVSMLVAPIVGGRRIGSLLFAGEGSKFNDADFIVAEFAATTIGMVIANRIDLMQKMRLKKSNWPVRPSRAFPIRRSWQCSISSMSLMGTKVCLLPAGLPIMPALPICDRQCSAQLASAGVVESRSLGMKGTYLRILNKEIRNEFEQQRYPYPKRSLDNPGLRIKTTRPPLYIGRSFSALESALW